MSGVSATSFFLAAFWLGMAIAAALIASNIIEHEDAGAEGEAVKEATLRFIWTVGLLFTAGYAAAGVGLSMEKPWGKAMAWVMMPWTLLLVLPGAPIGIYQMVALPKHP